ncbi:hypothetical protein Trydic_g22521 [Trypoxylus dichotomus]
MIKKFRGNGTVETYHCGGVPKATTRQDKLASSVVKVLNLNISSGTAYRRACADESKKRRVCRPANKRLDPRYCQGTVKHCGGGIMIRECLSGFVVRPLHRINILGTKKACNGSINDWAVRVRSLATHYEFGQELDVCLRDRFIMGFPRGPVLDRLLEENVTITLADAVKIASNKMVAQDHYGISEAGLCASVKEEPLHVLQESRGRSARPTRDEKYQICGHLHETHMGVVKSKSLARSYFWWSKLDKQIEELCKNCTNCNRYKNNPTKAQLNPCPFPSQPRPLLSKYILVIVDAYTKWAEAFDVNSITSHTTINLLRSTFARFGLSINLR